MPKPSRSRSLLPLLPILLYGCQGVSAISLTTLTASYGLDSATYNYSMPSTALNSNDANSWIDSNWGLYSGKVDFGVSDIVFSPDPSTSSSTLVRRAETSTTTKVSSTTTSTSTKSSTNSIASPASTNLAGLPPVLRIGYPAGSYSKSTGGTQFYSQPLNSTKTSTVTSTTTGFAGSVSDGQYERMLLSYDIWFPSGYAWNMGGKLPGLRGGPDPRGCSGGSETNGTSCFSTRLMWRTSGAGEVYAYIPTSQPNFCTSTGIICNSDYGTSLSRGSFSFATGQWQTIWLVVILNTVGTANGIVQLYYNGVQALSFSNLELRSSASLASIGGLYFSTFFGGDDSTWATPTDQYTYFRNIQLFAGLGAANGTGAAVTVSSSAGKMYSGSTSSGAVLAAAMVILGFMSGIIGL